MFEIKVADVDVTNGTIPISWCLDIETVKTLSDRRLVDPQVVIVVAPEDEDKYGPHKERRYVVPLKDLMAYVEFKAPGKNRIWAFISFKDKKEARGYYLSRARGHYVTDVLTDDGQDWGWIFSTQDDGKRRPDVNAEPISVDVPAGVFAPEPSDAEKAWVNHFFRDKCIDQCEFRRRRLFAYGVQPFIMLGQLVIRLFFLLVALLIGARNTSFMPLLHPLRYDLSEATKVCTGGSVFIRHLKEDEPGEPDPKGFWPVMSYIVRSFWCTPLMPAVWIPVALLWHFHKLLLAGAIAGGVLVAVIAILFFATGGAKAAFEWVVEKFQKPVTYWYVDQNEIDLLTCNPNKKAFTLSTLPAEKKTLYLRFQDLKSKVCRPFSA